MPQSQYLERIFYKINNRETFANCHASMFPYNKVKIDFVRHNNGKRVDSIETYVDIHEMLALGEMIRTGRLSVLAKAEFARVKESGDKYAKAIWESMGGTNAQKCKERGWRSDGQAMARTISISPGTRQPYILKALQGAGKEQETGLISMVGAPEKSILVATDLQGLVKMAIAVDLDFTAYISGCYAQNMFWVDAAAPHTADSCTEATYPADPHAA